MLIINEVVVLIIILIVSVWQPFWLLSEEREVDLSHQRCPSQQCLQEKKGVRRETGDIYVTICKTQVPVLTLHFVQDSSLNNIAM